MNKTKAPKGALVCFPVFVFLSIPLVHRGFPPTSTHLIRARGGGSGWVDALIVCYRRFFASVKVHFLPQYFCHLRRFFIAILNGIRPITLQSCASTITFAHQLPGFHRQDNKREKSSKLRLKKPLCRRIIVCFFYHPFCMRGAKRCFFCDAANCRKPGAGR